MHISRKRWISILFVVVAVGLFFAEKYADKKTEDYPNTSTSDVGNNSAEFGDEYLPESTTDVVVTHLYYALSYVEKHEQAEWVAYELSREHLRKNDFKRPYFVQDRDVKSKSADWRNYKKSGYDRGHLCPAGDRTFSYDAFHETFLTSNISPQNHDFNGGVWNKLEQKVRYWAQKHDGVYVITGGVLKNGLKSIGDERVSVPEEFYKIVLDTSEGATKVIAFLIPNKSNIHSFYDYVVTVDEIERVTGIDFFSSLPEAEEKRLERMLDKGKW